ncbi:hypothetical protein ACEQ8H_004343 [Pleosporales sp. CAS-2024a]
MPRGLAVQASSRAPNTGNDKSLAQASATAQPVQHEASVPKQYAARQDSSRTISARRKSVQNQTLSLAQQQNQQQVTSGYKSPAYLQGKNPYGQVLDGVEHPYREARPPKDAGPASQAGASPEGRPRTTGAFNFKTRATPQAPDLTVVGPEASAQLVLPRQFGRAVSVQATKQFFESKALQNQPSPVSIHSGAKTTSESQVERVEKESPPSQTDNPNARRLAHLSSRPTTSVAADDDKAERASDSAQPQPHTPIPNSDKKPGSKKQDSPIRDGHLPMNGSDVNKAEPRHRQKAAALPKISPHEVSTRGPDGRINGDDSTLEKARNAPSIGVGKAKQHQQSRGPRDTVRRRTFRVTSPVAERKESRANEGRGRSQGHQSSGLDRFIRRIDDGDMTAAPHTNTLIEPFAKSISPLQKSKTTRYSDDTKKAAGLRKLNHGDSNPRDDTSIHEPDSLKNVGVSLDYFEVEVPDHVDWRGAYGRRKTQDFGFPGARVRSAGLVEKPRPLEDPGDWIRRSCGHFSHLGKTELRSSPAQRPCGQCLSKAPLQVRPGSRKRSASRRAIAHSSNSGSYTLNTSDAKRPGISKRHRRHSESISADKFGNGLGEDIGHFIDAIVEEHTKSLQGIISNIEQARPHLTQVRRVTSNLVLRSIPKRPACQSQRINELFNQPAPKLQATGTQFSQWHIPPISAEKLNVGLPGQLKPNINDSPVVLNQVVRTVSDLVDLVKSVADNLGVDFDSGPTASDDMAFEVAPMQCVQLQDRHAPETRIGSRQDEIEKDSVALLGPALERRDMSREIGEFATTFALKEGEEGKAQLQKLSPNTEIVTFEQELSSEHQVPTRQLETPRNLDMSSSLPPVAKNTAHPERPELEAIQLEAEGSPAVEEQVDLNNGRTGHSPRPTTHFDSVHRIPNASRSQDGPLGSVSMAPGIEVAGSQPSKSLRLAKPVARRRIKVPNYAPEEQYPPAPAYPSRKTPTWTRPDTQTPPRRLKKKAKPEKRVFWRKKQRFKLLVAQGMTLGQRDDTSWGAPLELAASGPRRQSKHKHMQGRWTGKKRLCCPCFPETLGSARDEDGPVRIAPIKA